MKSKITVDSEKGYILVEPQAGNFWEICECFGNELKVPEYKGKNAIWKFPDAPLELLYKDLYQIREIVFKNYPQDAKPDRKVALVAQSGLHNALAIEYIRIAEDLPIKFRAFSDLPSAEEWIISNHKSSPAPDLS